MLGYEDFYYLTEVARERSVDRAAKLGSYLADRHFKQGHTSVKNDIKFVNWKGLDKKTLAADTAYSKHAAKRGEREDHLWNTAPVHKLHVKSLNMMQDGTSFESHYAKDKKFKDDKPVEVIKHKGQHYLINGHHRYMAARLQNKSHIHAHVVDLDQHEGGIKGFFKRMIGR